MTIILITGGAAIGMSLLISQDVCSDHIVLVCGSHDDAPTTPPIPRSPPIVESLPYDPRKSKRKGKGRGNADWNKYNRGY